ncbi:hypothetical protein CBM2634_U150008 [Cupriavidus taiwanensis]|uniref:Uncharacterized protein n=1 Tax=Cupriavidus taiwanensis TaxID=164546 RepID=A0A375JG09_9BURK|nr:hypothetical protein CBM2634_U150008 [Cupriavidus taiwanensis]
MADTRLTWHVGSVLPYASLWHTVLRACALNALHPHELPCRGAHPAATVELLERAGSVDIAAFARWLGEPPEAFRWSTLGVLPSWLSAALAVPWPRLCFACLAAGYHTALFSIALLDACPDPRYAARRPLSLRRAVSRDAALAAPTTLRPAVAAVVVCISLHTRPAVGRRWRRARLVCSILLPRGWMPCRG